MVNTLWVLMEAGVEELKLLQTAILLITTSSVVQHETLARVSRLFPVESLKYLKLYCSLHCRWFMVPVLNFYLHKCPSVMTHPMPLEGLKTLRNLWY